MTEQEVAFRKDLNQAMADCDFSLDEPQEAALVVAYLASSLWHPLPPDNRVQCLGIILDFLKATDVGVVAKSSAAGLTLPLEAPHWPGSLSLAGRTIEISLEEYSRLLCSMTSWVIFAGLIHETSHILAGSLEESQVGILDTFITLRLFGEKHPITEWVRDDLILSQGDEKNADLAWTFAHTLWSYTK